MPRVSVLTPIYNTNPEYLRQCIESVLNQTFSDFEFLILNDSPDNTELDKVIASYKDKRIRYFKNDKNLGISASRNKLLGLARGEYIAIFDHDDISLPERLQTQVDFLDKNPSVGVVSAWPQLIGVQNEIRRSPEYDVDIKMEMMDNCIVSHTSAMMRKSVLDENHIEYEEYYSPAEDYRLFGQLMSVTKFHILPMVLVQWRWAGQNTSVVQAKKMARMHDAIQVELINKFPAYYNAWLRKKSKRTSIRFLLFGIIPLFKIKRRRIYLFGFIPLFAIRWE